MSVWNHSLCDECWKEMYPDREPHRTSEEPRAKEVCCGCGFDHRSGIVMRADPREMHCKGMIGIHRERS